MPTVAFDSLRSCLHAKKTRNSNGLEWSLDITRSNSASTSTKSPQLSMISWIPAILPFVSISSNLIGPFHNQFGFGSGRELGACAAKNMSCEAAFDEDSGSDFCEQSMCQSDSSWEHIRTVTLVNTLLCIYSLLLN